MTSFEAAGYTRDTKFRVVRSYGNFRGGEIVWLKHDDNTLCPTFTDGINEEFMYLPNDPDLVVQDLELYSVTDVKTPIYPNPRHKHADVIHAWAEGADIEYKSSVFEWWDVLSHPSFNGGGQYRVKPSKPQKQIEKEALQEQLAKIEQETALLKQQLSKLGE